MINKIYKGAKHVKSEVYEKNVLVFGFSKLNNILDVVSVVIQISIYVSVVSMLLLMKLPKIRFAYFYRFWDWLIDVLRLCQRFQLFYVYGSWFFKQSFGI